MEKWLKKVGKTDLLMVVILKVMTQQYLFIERRLLA